MTTVAFDGRYLAADTQSTYDNLRFSFGEKIECIARNKEREYVACAGSLPGGLEVKRWFAKGAVESERPSDPEVCGIYISNRSVFTFFSPGLFLIPMDSARPIAVGSGADIALGAMYAGASAKKAVEIAMELDVNTGGEVQVVDLKWVLKGKT